MFRSSVPVHCVAWAVLLLAGTLAGAEEPVVVDVRNAPPITYNIAIPAVPVFPGDQLTWFSSAKERFRTLSN